MKTPAILRTAAENVDLLRQDLRGRGHIPGICDAVYGCAPSYRKGSHAVECFRLVEPTREEKVRSGSEDHDRPADMITSYWWGDPLMCNEINHNARILGALLVAYMVECGDIQEYE